MTAGSIVNALAALAFAGAGIANLIGRWQRGSELQALGLSERMALLDRRARNRRCGVPAGALSPRHLIDRTGVADPGGVGNASESS